MRSESLHETIRQVPDTLLAKLYAVPTLVGMPRLYLEKNGRGDLYYTLRYSAPKRGDREGGQQSLYIGQMTDEEAEFMQGWITMCWYSKSWGSHTETREVLTSYVQSFQRERQQWIKRARRAASACGFSLHGYELRRTRKGSAEVPGNKPQRRNKALGDLAYYLFMANADKSPAFCNMQEIFYGLIVQPTAAWQHDNSDQLTTSIQRLHRSMLTMKLIGDKIQRAQELVKKERGVTEATQ